MRKLSLEATPSRGQGAEPLQYWCLPWGADERKPRCARLGAEVVPSPLSYPEKEPFCSCEGCLFCPFGINHLKSMKIYFSGFKLGSGKTN